MTAKAVPNPQGIIIELLDPKKHDRTAFSCGVDRLDNFLKRTAKKHQTENFTRVWIARYSGQAAILGFYAMNAHSLGSNDLPDHLTKNAPQHGQIPAAYLSMIAVDHRHQNQGIGRILLVNALNRAERVADEMGLAAVILDVIEDSGTEAMEKLHAFYAHMGFQSFSLYPLRMFVSIKAVRRNARPS